MSPETPLSRMAPWELLLVWITLGGFLGVVVGLVAGHVRYGGVVGACIMVAIGSGLELLQWWKESR